MSASDSDDSKLTEKIEALLRGDPEVARLNGRVREAQRRLRRLCSSDAWLAYLDLEAIVNERFAHVCDLLLRSAGQGDEGSR